MGLFLRLKSSDISTEFTHKALLFGVLPVYLNIENKIYCVSNGYPRFLSNILLFVAKIWFIPMQILDGRYEPEIKFKITGKLR